MRAATTAPLAAADADYIKIADVEAVRDKLGSRIVAATGVMNSFDRMRIEGREEDVAIIGTDEYYPVVRNLDLLAGRFFDARRRATTGSHVALLMEKLARRLFGASRRPSGKTIKLHGLQFTVIGTFREKDRKLRAVRADRRKRADPDHRAETISRRSSASIRLYVQARTPRDVEPLTSAVQVDSRRPAPHRRAVFGGQSDARFWTRRAASRPC